MQISLNWLNELINIETIDLEELIEKLTLGGFEVEEIVEIEINNRKTITLEISATANRSDSLSISGLALEIGILLNQSPKFSPYRKKNFLFCETLQNKTKSMLPNLPCSDFVALTIQNVNTLKSPKWLQQKLQASGIDPENSLKDFQNYLLLENGYPFEFYDLNKICAKLEQPHFNLHLSQNSTKKVFKGTNELSYNLTDSILTLSANALPISIAGILPNKNVEYCNETTSLLIEASIFSSTYIRQKSKLLSLRTDRSSRYEKSIKNTNLFEAVYRLISLLRIANPKLTCKLHTIAQSPTPDLPTITVDYQNIKKILGPISDSKLEQYEYISPDLVFEYLKRLQFTVKYDVNNLKWDIIVPTSRSEDIVQEIDVIEEIGRLYGFNNFLTRLPTIHQIGEEDFSYQARKKMTACLINLGFTELIQYSLIKPTNSIKNEIQLINPLVQEYSTLRTSLIPSLIKTAENNRKKSNIKLEGFEYSHIFWNNDSKKIQEKEVVAGIFGGIENKSMWSESTEFLTWFEAKGKIEKIFRNLNLTVYWKSHKSINKTDFFHSYRTAKLFLLNGETLGVFGQINPIVAKKSNLSSELYLFEFDFELIKETIKKTKLAIYQEYISYPSIIKDLSFIIPIQTCFAEIKSSLYLNGSTFLVNISLLDEYRGASIPIDSTSLCLQLTFQSNKETLQNTTVDTIVKKLKTVLTTQFNATIRS